MLYYITVRQVFLRWYQGIHDESFTALLLKWNGLKIRMEGKDPWFDYASVQRLKPKMIYEEN